MGPILVAFLPPSKVVDALHDAFADVHIAAAELSGAQVVSWAQAHKPRALLVSSGQRLDADAIDALPSSVRIIATSSVGYDHLAVEAAQKRHIVLSHTPFVLTECTADLAMMLVLCACRRGRDYLDFVRAGWPKRLGQAEMLGLRLRNRTMGIVGMGRIGQALALRARAFGMSIAYHNRRRLPPELELGASYCPSLDALLPQSDVLSLHAPGTPQTQGLIDAAALARLPKDSVLINVARGSLVDEDALYDSLVSGHLFAAGLDVFANEPGGNARLMGLSQVFATPHCGSATQETREAMGQMCIESIESVLAGHPPKHTIAPGEITHTRYG